MTMMKFSARLWLAPFVVSALFGSAGCFLISADFEGDVKVRIPFRELQDTEYRGVETVDPNDYDDYRDNKDRIQEGELLGIDVTFVEVPSENAASFAVGQIDVKRADASDDEYITAVGEWNGVNIEQDNSFPVQLSPVAKGQVDELLFGSNPGALDLRIIGITDTATISFTAQVTIRLRFTAGI